MNPQSSTLSDNTFLETLPPRVPSLTVSVSMPLNPTLLINPSNLKLKAPYPNLNPTLPLRTRASSIIQNCKPVISKEQPVLLSFLVQLENPMLRALQNTCRRKSNSPNHPNPQRKGPARRCRIVVIIIRRGGTTGEFDVDRGVSSRRRSGTRPGAGGGFGWVPLTLMLMLPRPMIALPSR